MLHTILIVGALVCFGLTALEVAVPRINLLGLGAFLLTLTLLV